MTNETLFHTFIPELGVPRKGKVRDVYDLNGHLMMVASDRISVFDKILKDAIPDKGRILTEITLYWFEQTKDIIRNHLESHPDPSVIIVKKCDPIKLEIVVRGYLVGSLWRDYEKGNRHKCGVEIPSGLKQNDPLPSPIITPTTKNDSGHDEDISKKDLLEKKIVTKELWNEIESISLKLFERGQKIAKEKGLLLLDTKYEFGLDKNGKLILIDEIHTPDSSRFFFIKDVEKKEYKSPDKEFARQWAKENGFIDKDPTSSIPPDISVKIRQGYINLYKTIIGKSYESDLIPPKERLLFNLQKEDLIKGYFVLIIAENEQDQDHIDMIAKTLDTYNIPHGTVFASKHKNLGSLVEAFNYSIEPVVCITTKGEKEPLSQLMSEHLDIPVIACPKQTSDPGEAAKSAAKILEQD